MELVNFLQILVFLLLPAFGEGQQWQHRLGNNGQPQLSRPPSRSALAGDDCLRQIFNVALLPSPDAYLRTPEMIRKYGYPVETHRTTSKDGYISQLFRIPHGRKDTRTAHNFPAAAAAESNGTRTQPVVLLFHGVTQSSADWFMQPDDDSFPFMLANAGYDVWVANARGNSYSKQHTRLSPSQPKFWNFSFDEMGRYDLPVTIDYILNKTGESKLYYVGFSMGGTVFYITMALFPEYNHKIRSMYSLAGAAYVGNIKSGIMLLAPFLPSMQFGNSIIGWAQLLPPLVGPLTNSLGPFVCAPSPVALGVCGAFFFSAAGFDPCQFNTTQQISKIIGHTPDSVSMRTAVHYLQMILSNQFHAFNYGLNGNMRVYGQKTPPIYDLAKVTAKVAVFWGQNDIMVVPKDQKRLLRELPNVIANHRVAFDLWNHVDFLYAIDAKVLVYDEIMRLMAKHY